MALFGKDKKKELGFERTFAAPIATVWEAWTRPDMIREWWGPEKTVVPECEIDLRVGGRIRIVTEATSAMGKYRGTRWPMDGTFTVVEPGARLAWEARSWTEGEEASSTIVHTNDLTMEEVGGDKTTVRLDIVISEIGPGARMAAFGMKYGYKQYLEKLDAYLGRSA